jgi:hypothetical protein
MHIKCLKGYVEEEAFTNFEGSEFLRELPS